MNPKERPILFSAPMVRAILEGRKAQTRRTVKPQPYIDAMGNFCWNGRNFGQDDRGPHIQAIASPLPCSSTKRVHCPYGKPGERLWVRETWAQPTTLNPGPTFYRADYPACVARHRFENVPPADEIRWKPSIHMPRSLSRILLEVTAVRVERLLDISEADAIAEGIQRVGDGWERFHVDPDAPVGQHFTRNPVLAYRGLWESINGAGSWDANPWAWVIEFRRIKA